MLKLVKFECKYEHERDGQSEKVQASINNEMLEKVLFGLKEFISADGKISSINMSRQIHNNNVVECEVTPVSTEAVTTESETEIDCARKNSILAGIRMKNQLKNLYGDSVLNDATLTMQMTYA